MFRDDLTSRLLAADRANVAASTRRPLLPFVGYLVAFYAVWIGWVYLVYPRMVALGPATLQYALVNVALRLAIWVVPVFLYLRFIDRVQLVVYLKLRQHWRRGVLVGLGLTALNFAGMVVRFGAPHLQAQNVTWNSVLSTSLLIGFIEEIPFRGFIFQKLQERLNFWVANLLSSLLFVGIHVPGWILLHELGWSTALPIFALGAIFAIAFHYSKSLWSSILAHSLNDFLSAVLFAS